MGCVKGRYHSEVVTELNAIYPKQGDTKVFHKSLLRAFSNLQLDSNVSFGATEGLNKVYYYEIGGRSLFNLSDTSYLNEEPPANLDQVSASLDSIVNYLEFELLSEAKRKNEEFAFYAVSENEEIDQMLVTIKMEKELHVVHAFGKLDLSSLIKLLPQLEPMQNMILPL